MNTSLPKKITIVGNCQAPVIAKLLRGCSLDGFEINSFLLHRYAIDHLDALLKDDEVIVLSMPCILFSCVMWLMQFSDP